MEKIRYESPKMTFVNLRANEAIANECWKWAGKPSKENPGDDPLFYDTPGEGYVKFSVYGSGNCSAGNTELKYIITQYMKPDGDTWTDAEKKDADAAFDQWFETYARANGPSFKGKGFSEDKPGGDWS